MARVARSSLAAVLIASAPGTLLGQTVAGASPDTVVLDLREAQRLAVTRNPLFLSAAQEIAIARGDRRQAGLYAFNPDLGALFPGGLGGGADRRELSLTQEVEWAGQRGLRIGAANLGVTQATASVRDAGRRIAGDAGIAFYQVLAARARSALAEQSLTLSERLIVAVRTQFREGEISSLEANLGEIEVGRARARVLSARREATAAEFALKQVTGLGPEVPIRVIADSTSRPIRAGMQTDSLVQLALARRPDYAAVFAALGRARTLVALGRREAIPNVRGGVVTDADKTGSGQRVGLAIGFALPVLNRNQGLIERRRAEVSQLDLQLRATELAVRTEVVNAVQAYEAAAAEVAIYETSVLQPARRNVELLESAYRAGKLPLPTLLLLRNQLLEAELNYWAVWFALRESAVRLDVATAAISQVALPIDSTPTRTPR